MIMRGKAERTEVSALPDFSKSTEDCLDVPTERQI